jgi:hypothetical protein
MTMLKQNLLQDIISDIESESCVLIVGSDIVDFEGKSFFDRLCEDLKNDNQLSQFVDLNEAYIFVNEELLQLKPSAKETMLLRYIERFYKKQTQYNEPFRKIAEIPFHLIVSLLPDARLKNTFEEKNLSFQYGYYPREENPKPVERPGKKKPLLYNIFGDFSEGDAIITFDHLFTYLSGIMGKRELPQIIQETFKKARTFIFLGVHFERWYVQLMLRIITAKDNKEKYSILKQGSNNEMCTFIARRLELDFMEIQPVSFLDQLYEGCKQQNLLKTVKKSARAKVFISYSHHDIEMVERIETHLRGENIEVIIDSRSMFGGQKIEEFIEKIKDVHCVLPVISRNSLCSPWVSKEISTTLNKTNAYFLPCYLDNSFLDQNFVQTAEEIIDGKIKLIDGSISQRGKGFSDDLFNERKDWTECFNNLPVILNELKGRKCISIIDNDFNKGISLIVQDIINSSKI